MKVRNNFPLEIRYIPSKGKHTIQSPQSPRKSAITPIIQALKQRNQVIESMYRAQQNLQFSRSSLFLGVGLLDKLILKGFCFSQEKSELVGGTLLLVSTKFNEVYPVTVRKINLVMTNQHSLEELVELESQILHKLEFNLTLQDSLYEKLAQLESKYSGNNANICEQLIKTALMNPTNTFKHGGRSLLMAIQSFLGGLNCIERAVNSSFLHSQMLQIRGQLNRLHSNSRKRLVSPCRV